MIFPLLPLFVTAVLGAGPTFLGAIEGAADTVSSLLQVPFGRLADRARRKPLVVGGYAAANLARPLVALATAPWHVLVVRLLDRTGKGMRTAPRDALLADSAGEGERGRAFGFHRAMDHIGAVIGPLLASALFLLVGRDYRALFLIASLPGLATVAFTIARIEEVERSARPAPPPVPVAADLARFDRRFLALLAALFVFGLGASSDAFLLLRL
jgi:MFS family permease